VPFGSRQPNYQYRQDGTYSCVTHALGDHQTQPPYPASVVNFVQTRAPIIEHDHRHAGHHLRLAKTRECVPGRKSWRPKLRSGLQPNRYASEHAQTARPRMSVIQTKTGSKKPGPPSKLTRSRANQNKNPATPPTNRHRACRCPCPWSQRRSQAEDDACKIAPRASGRGQERHRRC